MFTIEPIGVVRSTRTALIDDGWDAVEARIELVAGFDADALLDLDAFSHVEILFYFDRVPDTAIERGARHPRGNADWPRVGIFAQRGKMRPNRLGSTIVRLLACAGTTVTVAGLDAVDGTPVIDIKPVMSEFLPREPVRQPAWSRELMLGYWK